MSVYNGEMKTWKGEEYESQHVKYHNIFKNIKEYGYQDLDTGLKVHYLLNGVRCDKLFMAIATVKSQPGKYEKDFDAVVTFLIQ